MKVPNFKGVRVCSKYDGRGVIERVFVDRNIHFAIKFQSNQTKNFFVPMAFNSGLLSTGNTQLNEYLQTLKLQLLTNMLLHDTILLCWVP